jgi:hypothetical protein
MSWTQSYQNEASNVFTYEVDDVKHDADYAISINNKIVKQVKSNADGTLRFEYTTNKKSDKIVVICVSGQKAN